MAVSLRLDAGDARGTGLSDWDVDELSLDAWVSDLSAVADAAGLKRFPLLGQSQGCAVSIAYTARHPERVSHLVLLGGYALGGNKRSPQEKEKRAAMTTAYAHRMGRKRSRISTIVHITNDARGDERTSGMVQ